MFKSPTHGYVTIPEIAQIIKDKILSDPGEYNLMVGTDSQNFDKTRMVTVIALHNVGHGGIFFYDAEYIFRIPQVNRKIMEETSRSLNTAQLLISELESFLEDGFDYTNYVKLEIHVDAGNNGASKQVIPEIIGWVKSCGFEVSVKPDSYAASSIANKYSK